VILFLWHSFVKLLLSKPYRSKSSPSKLDGQCTSRECSECSYTDKENRKSQSEFVCLKCLHTENADFNAAKVGRGYCVSTIGIDEQRIREYVQWQENKEKEIEKLQGNLFGEEND